jgi:hypothetical protein
MSDAQQMNSWLASTAIVLLIRTNKQFNAPKTTYSQKAL